MQGGGEGQGAGAWLQRHIPQVCVVVTRGGDICAASNRLQAQVVNQVLGAGLAGVTVGAERIPERIPYRDINSRRVHRLLAKPHAGRNPNPFMRSP